MSKKSNDTALAAAEQRAMLGDQLSFAAAEAYKLLRTNLTLTLTDGGKCQIIGVTSSIPSEGKSTTAVNLAYVLAESGKQVLLLEADMRLPTAAKRLGLKSAPGLSNLLVGLCNANEALQRSDMQRNLYVITAGDVPPNPSELLGSEQMGIAVGAFAKSFDYIILDLPPVNAVADALIMSKLVSGIVVVVRKDYCKKQVLRKTLRQLELLHVKVLGFVMTHADTHSKSYKYSGYYSYGKAGKKSSREQKKA
jgi:capsular exopolysaccharide synthesis family protein